MSHDEVIHFVNGHIYTGEYGKACTDFSIRNGKIEYVGYGREIVKSTDEVTIDLGGHFVMPGFVDSHVHPVDGRQLVGDYDLTGITNPDEITARIRECANATTAGFVHLGGVDLSAFGAYPDRKILDAIVPDKPLILIGYDVHSGALNSRALQIAGITSATPDPEGGIYERFPGSDEPSGVVHESGLHRLFSIIPQLSPSEFPASLASAQNMAHKLGVIGWFEARATDELLAAYAGKQQANQLKVYVSLGLYADPAENIEAQINKFISWRDQYQTEILHVNTVKIFIDGVVESQTALLNQPYLHTSELGKALWTMSALKEVVQKADKAGFDLHFHTIGDGAVKITLDALEYANQVNGYRERRAQLAHLMLVNESDMKRFTRVGAIASIQSYWSATWPEQQEQYLKLLGEQRVSQCYPFKSLRNHGILLSGGSDWSVTTMNPLDIMEVAVTHRPLGEVNSTPWNPDERLDLQTMIDAHTCNSAFALRFEHAIGKIQPGMDASFVILKNNPFLCEINQLHNNEVLETYFKGECVYCQ